MKLKKVIVGKRKILKVGGSKKFKKGKIIKQKIGREESNLNWNSRMNRMNSSNKRGGKVYKNNETSVSNGISSNSKRNCQSK